ncbi:MAG: BrnA antitoxin family protein [Phycisphaerales bacterium]|nr:BrnA antitoxin family protein [Phycisphaerales bacterium]MCI0630584.1 BrnA antitoxin family protein [Phycisphaerales bacterium]
MKKRSTSKLVRYTADNLPRIDAAELKRIQEMTDDQIDLSDTPEIDATKRLEQMEQVTLHLDRKVVDWFRQQGPGIENHMRNILNQYMRLRRLGPSQAEEIAEAVFRRLQKRQSVTSRPPQKSNRAKPAARRARAA